MTQTLTYDLQLTLRTWEQAQLNVSLCTVKRRADPPVVDASGQVDMTLGAYSTTVISNVACQLSVWRMKPDEAAVTRLEDRFDTLSERHILLDGYYPQILQRDLAIVDGVTYEIMAVENDSQGILTRLAVRTFAL